MLNSIVIMGRLTADPELMTTNSGVSVCSFDVAVDRDYAPNGEKQTDFISVVTWRQTAEFVSRYFAKGRMMLVQGSLQSRKYQDKDGNNRVKWEVQADRVWFGETKKDSADDAQRETPPVTKHSTARKKAYDSMSEEDFTPMPDDDLPF